jgi:hypothetical protein
VRVLVVDESGVLPWVVSRLVGPEVEIRAVDSFDAAVSSLRDDSPDAAVVSLTGARLPWCDFQHACALHRPPVPVLYESCLGAGPSDLGLSPVEGWAEVLVKPAGRAEREAALSRLLATARAQRH